MSIYRRSGNFGMQPFRPKAGGGGSWPFGIILGVVLTFVGARLGMHFGASVRMSLLAGLAGGLPPALWLVLRDWPRRNSPRCKESLAPASERAGFSPSPRQCPRVASYSKPFIENAGE
jgi:hypothetical protein